MPPSVARPSRPASPTAAQKREWNRGPLTSLFPRLAGTALECILDLLHKRQVRYDLSESRLFNARRFTRIIVAHVRHAYTDYDTILDAKRREEADAQARSVRVVEFNADEDAKGRVASPLPLVDRYAVRLLVADKMWKVLRGWSPWDTDNPVLERCFRATLVRPEERGEDFDMMDIDEVDDRFETGDYVMADVEADEEFDAMDLD